VLSIGSIIIHIIDRIHRSDCCGMKVEMKEYKHEHEPEHEPLPADYYQYYV